jgi:hypothetical protein
VSLLLIKAGCDLGDDLKISDWRLLVQPKKESNRTLRNNRSWCSPIDNDGFSPLDLLSFRLSSYLSLSKKKLESTSVQGFGVADFQLGIQLGNTSWHTIRPRRIDTLNRLNIVSLSAGKYHSLAVTRDGKVFSWGHGRGGRLGHGNEIAHPEPREISGLSHIHIISVSAGENHTLALATNGDVYSWGSNRFGQLGHGGKIENADNPNSGGNNSGFTSYCLSPKRIESLRRKRVLKICAASTHSLCSTEGEVYSWGSNKHGQLGVKQYDTTSLQNGSGHGISKPKAVDIKCQSSVISRSSSNTSQKNNSNPVQGFKVIHISAGPFNSLVLLKSDSFLSGNKTEIWQWGHGADLPSKVQFTRQTNSSSSNNNNNTNNNSFDLSSSAERIFHHSSSSYNVEMTQVSGDHIQLY